MGQVTEPEYSVQPTRRERSAATICGRQHRALQQDAAMGDGRAVPVGAAWRRSRPCWTAWIREAAISWWAPGRRRTTRCWSGRSAAGRRRVLRIVRGRRRTPHRRSSPRGAPPGWVRGRSQYRVPHQEGRPTGWPGGRRSPGRARTPEGDPVDLLVTRDQRPVGPKATTSLRNAVADMSSVTPTTNVVCRVRARVDRTDCSGVGQWVSRETTSSGHSTSCGAAPLPSNSRVSDIWAARTTLG